VDFFLFILVTGILFMRPMDFIPGLETIPLYYIAIVSCILVSWNKIATHFSNDRLGVRPVTAFMIGLLLVSVFSNLAHGNVEGLANFTPEYAKVLVYFMLLVGVVDTPRRLRVLLACLVIIDLVPTVLTLLHYHGMINIPAYEALNDSDSTRIDPETGGAATIRRLKGSGAFADPNDICEILNQAMVFALYFLIDRASPLLKLSCLAALPVFGYALYLTRSRGGFVGFLVSLAVLFWARYGPRKTILLGGLVFPVILVLFGGRQTSISASEGTGQSRIQLWFEGFALMRGSPIWGIGTGEFVKNVGRVAHNSFIHAYTELGFLGGTLYFGMFYYVLKTLRQLGRPDTWIPDPEIDRIRPYILAALSGYATTELSLTHCYELSTYVVLGMATACIGLADPEPPLTAPQLDGRLVVRMAGLSALFLSALYIYTQMTVRLG
jgi:hypothetical protein